MFAGILHNHKTGTGGYNSLFEKSNNVYKCSQEFLDGFAAGNALYLTTSTSSEFDPEPGIIKATQLEFFVGKDGRESRLNYREIKSHNGD